MTKHHRRHPRTRHDAQILCPIDCGNPPDLCRCLQAMLHDRDLTAAPAPVPTQAATTCHFCGVSIDPGEGFTVLDSDGTVAVCTVPACLARRAQGAQDPAPRPATPEAPSLAGALWRAIVRALGGGRA